MTSAKQNSKINIFFHVAQVKLPFTKSKSSSSCAQNKESI